eukprot:7577258-Pyramimonas_sp.AAC.1
MCIRDSTWTVLSARWALFGALVPFCLPGSACLSSFSISSSHLGRSVVPAASSCLPLQRPRCPLHRRW